MKSITTLFFLIIAIYAFSPHSSVANDSKGNKLQSSDFKITNPNGGEKFGVGTETVITWEGCAAEDEVTLEYSTDGGHDWITITENATGFEHEWQDIPNSISDSCLIKASVNDSTADNVQFIGFGTLEQVTYSHDGTKLASCGGGGIFIWNAATGETVLSIIEDTGYVTCIAYSPDGSRIAAGNKNGTVGIWDTNTGVKVWTLSKLKEKVQKLCFSQDGTKLAAGSQVDLKIWDTDSGMESLTRSMGGRTNITSLCFSPNGNKLAHGNRQDDILILDVNTGDIDQKLSEDTRLIRSLIYSSDGKKLICGRNRSIKIWNLETETVIKTFPTLSKVILCVILSKDGNKLASISTQNAVIFDVNSDRILEIISWDEPATGISVSFNPEGNSIASGMNAEIEIWDTNSGELIKKLSKHNNTLYTLCYSPDGNSITSGGDKTTIWDAVAGSKIKTLTAHHSPRCENSVCYSSDGNKIASADYRTIHIWDAKTGSKIRTLEGHTCRVFSLCFSPDDSRIVSGSENGPIKIWDAKIGSEIKTLLGHTDHVKSICYSPDGSRIASASQDHAIKIWDANTGEEIRTLAGHDFGVQSISYSPDGSRIVSGSHDKTIKIWDTQTGAEIITFIAHTKSVSSVSYNLAGNRIASASWDGKIKIWDANTGALIKTLSGHTYYIESLCYHPEGNKVASGGLDGTIRIWNVGTNDISDSVFAIAKTSSVQENTSKNNSSTYPNPFSQSITIEYTLEKAASVTINIYNSSGQLVSVIEEGLKNSGKQSARFDAEALPAGAYFYSIKSGENIESGKMQLVR